MVEPRQHISVLLEELVHGLAVVRGGMYVDCTLGGGGHAEAVLKSASPGGRLLGIDADPRAIRTADRRLWQFEGAYVLVNENFEHLGEIAKRQGFGRVNGVYFDLGLSSMQLAEEGRGFSFQRDEALDMRFGSGQNKTARDLLNEESPAEIARALRLYGEEPKAWAIARRVEAARPLRTTGDLVRVIEGVTGPQRGHVHPATRTFQAIRIWVNDELGILEAALRGAVGLLGSSGRLAVISFHSLEDRIVKTLFKEESRDCICPPGLPMCVCGHKASLRLVNKRVIEASAEEVRENPRSRSAKLRVAEKLRIAK